MPPSTKQSVQANDRLSSNNPVNFTHRERVALADVNAGYTLLPAIPGYKYRLTNMKMIAVGAAGAGAADVRVLATQAAASVALLVTALAALTRSAENFSGIANNTILADGASYAENDVNTAITIGKTGAALTGPTAIDFIVEYQLIPSRTGA